MRIITWGTLLVGVLLLSACGGSSGGGGTDDSGLPGDEPRIVVVTNLNDSGPGSLRRALANAPNLARVIFDAALPTGTITLLSPLVVDRSMEIGGLSGSFGRHRIDGDNSVGLFLLRGDEVSIGMYDLILADGDADAAAAIFADCNALFLARVQVVNCVSGGGAGAISAPASAFIHAEDCAFTLNRGAEGGALSMNGGQGLFRRCSFFLNEATLGGGGAVRTTNTDLNFQNCSFLQNKALHPAAGEGGALHFRADNGKSARFYVCTIAENDATSGGGLFAEAPAGGNAFLELHACISANNTGGATPDVHLVNANADGSYNLLGIGNVGNLFNGFNGNQAGVFPGGLDPQLSAVATDTLGRAYQTPAVAGPANNKVPLSEILNIAFGEIAVDQQGHPRLEVGMADIGAIEN